MFQLGDIVFGFVPAAAIPPGSGTINAGCGSGDDGVGGAFVGYGRTVAHELGHIYDRDHVAVPGDADNDLDYPRYGGDRRSIGEVGVDLGASPVPLYDPARSDDIMSYGDNRWILPTPTAASSMHAPCGRVFRPIRVACGRSWCCPSGSTGWCGRRIGEDRRGR